ncbi:MAG: GNAT family N-acetyltransferase, partial [Emcibacter sp.]|nr:GNAT family N-acetyltransferase [Emcibacter sp.]
ELQYQLRGMATLKAYQGFGAGKLMMQEAFSILTNLNVDYLWCNARIIAVNFYKKQGLKIRGASFEIPFVVSTF